MPRDAFFAAVVHAQTAYDGFDPGANNTVLTFAIEADGRILVGGAFTTLAGGGTGTAARHHLGRLNISGSLDTSFDPGANERVYAFAAQPDHKIVVGGVFTMLGGGGAGTTSRHRIARVNADGTLDATFDPDANGDVYALALQPDGRILVAGAFTAIGGFPLSRIARLNADGSVDATFTPAANDPRSRRSHSSRMAQSSSADCSRPSVALPVSTWLGSTRTGRSIRTSIRAQTRGYERLACMPTVASSSAAISRHSAGADPALRRANTSAG